MEKNESGRNKFLKISPYIAAIILVIYIICVCVSPQSNTRNLMYNILFAVPIAVGNFIIVKAYFEHNKNIMKSMIGFILSGLLMIAMQYAFQYISFSLWCFYIKFFFFLIIAVFAVNHFLLSNNHYSSPKVLFINQIIMDILLVMGIASTIIVMLQFGDNPLIYTSFLFFIIFTMFIVLEIEIQVNDYKLVRQQNGYVFQKSRFSEEDLTEENMFISNKVFYSLPWIVVIGLVCLFIFNAVFDTAITRGYIIRYLFYIIKMICLIVLINTYKSHNKNVMKNMNGFLLGMLLFENIYEVTFIKAGDTTLKAVLTMAMVAVNIVFLLAHFQLTRNHTSNEKAVDLLNRVFTIYIFATVLLAVGISIHYFIQKGDNYYFFLIKPLFWVLGTLPVVAGIITIDTRVNGYKLKREKEQ